jgi:hypothetical protein
MQILTAPQRTALRGQVGEIAQGLQVALAQPSFCSTIALNA